MKPKAKLLHFLLAAGSVLVSLPNADAAEYWWNQNGTASGWGAGGTWDGANFSTTNSDTASAGTPATTSSDTLNFGTSTVGFAGGSINGGGGIRDIGSVVTGSANNTADLTVTNIRLRFNNPGTITNNSPRVLNFAGILEGSATRLDLNANGGDIQLTGVASAVFTGIIYINTGTVLSNANLFGQTGSDSNRTVIASGARLLFNNNITYTERFEIAGAGVGGTTGAFVNSGNRSTTLNGQVTLSGNATTYSDSSSNALTFGGGIVLGANALTFNSVNAGSIQTVQTNAISGTNGSVVKSGSGVLNLNVASSYTGGTTLGAGTINIGAAISGSNNAIGSTSGTLTVNGGTLNMAGNNVTVGNLTGTGGVITGSSGTRTLTIGEGNGGGGNFQGVIGIGTGGTTALTKTGNGTITLSGANTYSGGTTVSAGTLLVNNTTGSGTGTNTVDVGANGILGGTGAISGAVNVTGQLSPGASIETLGTGILSMANSSTLVHELDSSVADAVGSDLLKVIGNLNLTGTVNLTLADLAVTDVPFAVNDIFSLINYTGTWNTGLFTFSGNELADEEVFTFGLNTWRISYDDATGGLNFPSEYAGGTDSFVNITAVTIIPEPGAALLSSLGILLLFRRRR